MLRYIATLCEQTTNEMKDDDYISSFSGWSYLINQAELNNIIRDLKFRKDDPEILVIINNKLLVSKIIIVIHNKFYTT